MALIDCAECGNQISDQAAACPKCGHPAALAARPEVQADLVKSQPVSEVKPGSIGLMISGVVMVIFLIGALLFFSKPGQDALRDAAEESAQKAKEKCDAAVLSAVGTNVTRYTDKQAYEQTVKKACAGVK